MLFLFLFLLAFIDYVMQKKGGERVNNVLITQKKSEYKKKKK